MDTGASVTITRPDVAAGWPEKEPSQRYMLQTTSEEALSILTEASMELALGRCSTFREHLHNL
jgi:hypothetical protein